MFLIQRILENHEEIHTRNRCGCGEYACDRADCNFQINTQKQLDEDLRVHDNIQLNC